METGVKFIKKIFGARYLSFVAEGLMDVGPNSFDLDGTHFVFGGAFSWGHIGDKIDILSYPSVSFGRQ